MYRWEWLELNLVISLKSYQTAKLHSASEILILETKLIYVTVTGSH